MKNVEWGEYRLGDLFEIVGTKSLDSNAIDFVDEGINFVGRTFEDNGVQGKIEKREFEPNEPYTITATVIGNYKYVKYQKEPYYCSQNINKLTPKPIINRWSEKIAYFMVTNIQKFVSLYDYQQGGYKLEDINDHIVKLPLTDNNEIDFSFMESLISELEEERISELASYLKVSKLDDYTLSDEEKEFINYDSSNSIESLLNNKLRSISWKEHKMDDLFERVNTKKLPYKAKELPTEPTGEYALPCLTSSFMNQGLNYYASRENATILKNVISIPSNSDVYRAYFQPNDFTILSDAYAICWKDKNKNVSEKEYLFMTQCINKVTDLAIYSYKNKLGGWNKAKEKIILLPEKNGEIDFDFMDKFIIIAEKLIIKDVVEYTDKKINATKRIVNNRS